ncbi:MAG: hypothetical protein J0G30_09820 [Actinomycetales bacterium]|nr:hypothetical protein [Actinomycetales bacterium]
MSVRIGVVVMAALLALYLIFALQYGVRLIAIGSPVAIAIGAALLVFPLLGAGALAAELAFGLRSERLARRLEAEGGMPTEELPARASGRVERAAADAAFPRYAAAVESSPEDWRARYRLALAYDAAGDRRRARREVRTALRLESAERHAAA